MIWVWLFTLAVAAWVSAWVFFPSKPKVASPVVKRHWWCGSCGFEEDANESDGWQCPKCLDVANRKAALDMAAKGPNRTTSKSGDRSVRVELSKHENDHPATDLGMWDRPPPPQNGGMIVGCDRVGSGTWRLFDHLCNQKNPPLPEDRIVAEVRRWYPTFDPAMERPSSWNVKAVEIGSVEIPAIPKLNGDGQDEHECLQCQVDFKFKDGWESKPFLPCQDPNCSLYGKPVRDLPSWTRSTPRCRGCGEKMQPDGWPGSIWDCDNKKCSLYHSTWMYSLDTQEPPR